MASGPGRTAAGDLTPEPWGLFEAEFDCNQAVPLGADHHGAFWFLAPS